MQFFKKHIAQLLAALALGAAVLTTWATVETSPQYPADLNATYPASTDPKSEGDDHIRNLKTVLKNTVAGFTGAAIVTGTDTGSANAYVLTPTPTLPSYTTGTLFIFKAVNANTGASTLNVSSLGTKSIKTIAGADPSAGEVSGEVILRFDGTNMVLTGGSSAVTKSGTQTVTAALTFTTAPVVPTATVGTSDTKAATNAFVTATGFLAALPGQLGNSGKVVTTDGANASWAALGMAYTARTSNTILAAADFAGTTRKYINVTSGSFTQTIDTAANIGAGGWLIYCNSGTGDVTLAPTSGTIDAFSSFIAYPQECRLIQSDGSNFNTIVLRGFTRTFTATAVFTAPPGYSYFDGILWGGGASGSKGTTTPRGAGGGGGGAAVPFHLASSSVSTTTTVTIAAVATGPSTTGTASITGNNSTFGTLVTAYGGARGAPSTGTGGGGGGGGGSLGTGADASGATGGTGGKPGTVAAGTDNQGFGGGGGATSSGPTLGGSSDYGGGGGGAETGTTAGAGGSTRWGGGGGGSAGDTVNVGAGGTSLFGGSGGAGVLASSGIDGSAPGGGGGATTTGTKAGDGARGEMRIWGLH